MKKKESKPAKEVNAPTSELNKKLKDLKIELLKQPLKRKKIRVEIARVLTQMSTSGNNLTKLEGKK